MSADAVTALLDAVRRRLWRLQLVVAVRWALWGSAALLLFSLVVHLMRPLPPIGVWLALALLWAALLVRVGLRRPAIAACALWADRHLDGASVFSTWTEVAAGPTPLVRRPGGPPVDTQAVQRLERWALAKAPQSLRLLAAPRPSARLWPALLSMAVCAALTAVVMTLPVTAPSRPVVAASAPAAGDRPPQLADAAAASELSRDIANALRAADRSDAPQRNADGRRSGASPAQSAGNDAAVSGTPDGKAGGALVPARDDASAALGAAAAERPASGAPPSGGGGSGREAGDSRDTRADAGTSRAAQVTMNAPPSTAGVRQATALPQADMARSAAFEGGPSEPGPAATSNGRMPAAATPPTADETSPLSATESSYVQAWMKATRQRR